MGICFIDSHEPQFDELSKLAAVAFFAIKILDDICWSRPRNSAETPCNSKKRYQSIGCSSDVIAVESGTCMKLDWGDSELEDNKSGLDGCELHFHPFGTGNPRPFG